MPLKHPVQFLNQSTSRRKNLTKKDEIPQWNLSIIDWDKEKAKLASKNGLRRLDMMTQLRSHLISSPLAQNQIKGNNPEEIAFGASEVGQRLLCNHPNLSQRTKNKENLTLFIKPKKEEDTFGLWGGIISLGILFLFTIPAISAFQRSQMRALWSQFLRETPI